MAADPLSAGGETAHKAPCGSAACKTACGPAAETACGASPCEAAYHPSRQTKIKRLIFCRSFTGAVFLSPFGSRQSVKIFG